MNADIAAFEASIAGHGSAVDGHISARVATVDDGMEIVDKLDPLIRNKYADSPAMYPVCESADRTSA